MPRLFTALELPADIVFPLALLRGGLPGARWIDAENFHVTLRFIGDVDERTADDVADTLVQVSRPCFSIELNGVGSFGSRRPHAVWAGVTMKPELVDLQTDLERRLQRIGLPPERRRFTPHVTLARVRGATQANVAHYLALRGAFRSPPFPVGRFVLLSSRASKGGGPYIVEEAYPLAA